MEDGQKLLKTQRNQITKVIRMNDLSALENNYKGFVVLPEPAPFNEFFAGVDIESVCVYSIQYLPACDDIVGFCGVFGWKDDTITSIDGDSYNSKMLVIAYQYSDSGGVSIIVGDDW